MSSPRGKDCENFYPTDSCKLTCYAEGGATEVVLSVIMPRAELLRHTVVVLSVSHSVRYAYLVTR